MSTSPAFVIWKQGSMETGKKKRKEIMVGAAIDRVEYKRLVGNDKSLRVHGGVLSIIVS